MVHRSQRERGDNIEVVRKVIASTMPNGARDSELRAVLSMKPYGFHPKTVNDYLETLLNAGKVVWDPDAALWKLQPVERPS